MEGKNSKGRDNNIAKYTQYLYLHSHFPTREMKNTELIPGMTPSRNNWIKKQTKIEKSPWIYNQIDQWQRKGCKTMEIKEEEMHLEIIELRKKLEDTSCRGQLARYRAGVAKLVLGFSC